MSSLNPRMLRYLDEISHCGSIRKAGEKLNVAPSSINRQLLALEDELGVRLFERLPRRMVPTTAGELLVEHARNTLFTERRMLDELDTLTGGSVPRCQIATVPGVAGDLLAHALAMHRHKNPGTTFSVHVTDAKSAAVAASANEVDVAFAFDMPRLPRTSVAAAVQTPCGAVVSHDHPLAGQGEVHLHQIMAFPLLLPRLGVTVRNSLEDAAWQTGLRLKPVLESDNFDLLRRCTAFDYGVAILNRVDVLHSAQDGRCVFIPLAELRGFTQELTVMHCAQSRPTVSTQLMIDRLAELLKTLPTE